MSQVFHQNFLKSNEKVLNCCIFPWKPFKTSFMSCCFRSSNRYPHFFPEIQTNRKACKRKDFSQMRIHQEENVMAFLTNCCFHHFFSPSFISSKRFLVSSFLPKLLFVEFFTCELLLRNSSKMFPSHHPS